MDNANRHMYPGEHLQTKVLPALKFQLVNFGGNLSTLCELDYGYPFKLNSSLAVQTFTCLDLDVSQQYERARAPIINICLIYSIMV